MNITERFFVDCIKAGISENIISDLPQGIDYKILYNLCVSHSASVIVFYAVQGIKEKLPGKFYNAINFSTQHHVMRDVQLGVDSKTVIDAFEENAIKFMPLKGYHLKKLYPKTEMRYTSDCDILIDKKEIKKIRQIVKELGLKTKRHDEHHDIVYFDGTKSIFELHKMLFVGELGKYFGIGFEKANLKEGFKYYYELSPEDFYMAMLAHSAYHFSEGGGVGIRHLADIYVYRKHYDLNENYLTQEFQKCGLREFQIQFEKLEKYFFENSDADAFTIKLADYVLESSVLGNKDKKSASDVSANRTKCKTLFKIIFPSVANMRFSYPVLNKMIFLLPFFYVVRWVRVIFKTPKRISKLKDINAVSEKDIEEIKTIRDGLGINGLK